MVGRWAGLDNFVFLGVGALAVDVEDCVAHFEVWEGWIKGVSRCGSFFLVGGELNGDVGDVLLRRSGEEETGSAVIILRNDYIYC